MARIPIGTMACILPRFETCCHKSGYIFTEMILPVWGRAASRRWQAVPQVPRDGIRAGSVQFRHAMVGADRVSLLRVALLLAVSGDKHVS
jgi:hypothetical protein